MYVSPSQAKSTGDIVNIVKHGTDCLSPRLLGAGVKQQLIPRIVHVVHELPIAHLVAPVSMREVYMIICNE
jgi:hypothetical protein